MLYFTKYAEKKFAILNKHKVYFTREQIEECLSLPDKAKRKGKYFYNQKDGVEVIYEKEADMVKVITFFPVKS